MSDNKGNKYVEHCYEGYGVFGGKDFYVLLAEMNGLTLEQFGDEDELRQAGIELAFTNSPSGENPDIIFPSLTESGRYYNGEPPHSDPDQGFPEDDYEEDYEEDEWDDEEDWEDEDW